jgi:hypothetical protein
MDVAADIWVARVGLFDSGSGNNAVGISRGSTRDRQAAASRSEHQSGDLVSKRPISAETLHSSPRCCKIRPLG